MSKDRGPYTSTATILFTDLVGSTAQRAELGEDAADELRRAHDGLLASAVDRHRGRIVKGGGDGIMAAFDSATDGIGAAVAIQQAVDLHNRRRNRIAVLEVRIGISTGDVLWEDGDGFGMPVIEAARLESAAQPGAILCSDFVRHATRGRGGYDFTSVGDLALKGITDLVPASEVRWQSLATELPPLPPMLAVEPPFPLTGRDAILADGYHFLDGSTATRALWLTGDPGSGKTALASAIAKQLREAGAWVMFGQADEEVRLPLGPFVQALGACADVAAAHQVPLLSPLFADPASIPSHSAAHDPSGQLYAFYSGVRDWLAELCQIAPVLLLLDDFHWATTPSVRLLRFLLEEPTDPGPMFVVTAREGQTPRSTVQLMRDVEASGHGLIRAVSPLTAADLMSMAHVDRRAAEAIHEQAAGNALYSTILLRSALSGGSIDVSSSADAIDSLLASLEGDVASLLEVAAVVGSQFDSRVVGSVCDLDPSQVIDRLEVAVAGGVIEEDSVNRFRFAQSVVRNVLRSRVGATRVAQLHLKAAHTIEQISRHETDQIIAELAYHFTEAAKGGNGLAPASEYSKRAGEIALGRHAYEDAAQNFINAADASEQDEGESAAAIELRIRAALSIQAGGEFRAAWAQLTDLAQRAHDHQWTPELAYAVTELQGSLSTHGLTTPEAVALLEAAAKAAEAGAPSLHGRVVARLAAAYRFDGRQDDAERVARHALQLAEQHDDAVTWAVVSDTLHAVFDDPDGLPSRLIAATRAITLAEAAGRQEELGWELWRRMTDNVQLGQLRDARLDLDHLFAIADDNRNLFLRQLGVAAQSMMAVIDDDLELAEELALQADDLRSTLSGEDTSGALGVQMYTIRRAQQRLRQIAPLIRANASATTSAWGPGLANLYAEIGMLDHAQELLHEFVQEDDVLLPRDDRWQLSMSYLADACQAVGDGVRAATLYKHLLPYERTWLSLGGVVCAGPATRYLGSLAVTMGAGDEGLAHLNTARESALVAGSPRFVVEADRSIGAVLGRDHG